MTKNILKRVLTIAIFTYVSMPITYLIRILYARTLSIEAYGLFYALIAFMGLIGRFNDLGTSPALVHYLPKYIHEKATKKIKAAITTVFIIEITTAIIIAITVLLLKKTLAQTYFKTNLAITVLPIFAFIFIVQNINDILVNVFKGYRKEALYSSMNPIRLLIVLIMSAIAATIFKENIITIFSLIWVSSFLVNVIIYTPFLIKPKQILKTKILVFDKKTTKELFKYGIFVMLTGIAGIFLGRIDTIMLTAFKGVKQTGLYETALPIAGILLTTTIPITTFLFPQISHYYHTKQNKAIKTTMQTIYNTGIFLFLPISVIIMMYPQEIITIMFGQKYLQAKTALQILTAGYIFAVLHGINTTILNGTGQIKETSKIIYTGAITNIILNLIMIPKLGITGAAIATSTSTLIMFMLSMKETIKKIKFKPSYKNTTKIIINTILFVVIVYLLKTTLKLNMYIEAGIILTTSGIIYLTIGIIWKIIDYQYIKKLIKETIKTRKTE